MWAFFHRLGSPKHFYHISGYWIPWFGWGFALLAMSGLYYALIIAPPDYQQGESMRILYVHVPSAWMSMFIYMVMAVSAAIALIWRMKLAEVMISAAAPIGASFTFLTLATGSLWGKPMWGTWWVWDARLTSELILLFLYLGVIALYSAIEDKRNAAKAASVLALVGVVNIPIIHYSVVWWNTLHQPATFTLMEKPPIATEMLIAWLLMALAFKLFFFGLLLYRARNEVLERERNTQWVRELVAPS